MKKQTTKKVSAWAVINCKGEFCEAYNQEVKAKVLTEELDYNWERKGAFYVPCTITYQINK